LPSAWPSPAAEWTLIKAALRRVGEAVGHAEHRGFLEPEHVAEVVREIAEHRQLGRSRIAEDRRDAELAKQFDRRAAHRLAIGLELDLRARLLFGVGSHHLSPSRPGSRSSSGLNALHLPLAK